MGAALLDHGALHTRYATTARRAPHRWPRLLVAPLKVLALAACATEELPVLVRAALLAHGVLPARRTAVAGRPLPNRAWFLVRPLEVLALAVHAREVLAVLVRAILAHRLLHAWCAAMTGRPLHWSGLHRSGLRFHGQARREARPLRGLAIKVWTNSTSTVRRTLLRPALRGVAIGTWPRGVGRRPTLLLLRIVLGGSAELRKCDSLVARAPSTEALASPAVVRRWERRVRRERRHGRSSTCVSATEACHRRDGSRGRGAPRKTDG
mmetsp:Transcript_85137/g.237603  ORF Transcript_85137/g.237603 Transcript_85137/m.237603 type:complete len:266 (+) Transcript_85137:809-1606(+)